MTGTVQQTPPTEATTPNIAAVIYTLRAAEPEELIAYLWKDTPHARLMLAIAAREACLYCVHRDGTPFTKAEICGADNPRSTASGLFQTMGFHRPLAEGIGLSWGNVVGADCLDDALLAWQLYDQGRGLNHWKPLPKV
jgi:hypothetical protein